ncbi:MAG TPA: hypothetical protein VFC56_03015 [Stellaceae bacterium]|nr:hypothetical protein [Stellaceae bacterium]
MAGLAVFASYSATAAPFVPTDDNFILQTGLPSADPRMREMRALAAGLAKQPDDLSVAMRLAGRQLAMGVAESDPRFVGYAQATLGRWWRDPAASPSLRVLRARVLQAQHNFAAAADDLHAALRGDPDNLQALLVLASVDEVDGNLAEAENSCAEYAKRRPGLIATACTANIASLVGQAAASERVLAGAVTQSPSPDRGEQAWVLVILGEIALRTGDPAANDYLQQAVSLDDRNVYALTTYADYLLDHDRARDVIRLLRGFERIDALDLRLVLAMQAVGDPGFAAARDDLAARFVAARRQHDAVHLRDASRFSREVEQNAPAALEFARQNWATHKAPEDVRLLLAAALACHDPSAAHPAVEWIASSHLEDRRLPPLLAQLGF